MCFHYALTTKAKTAKARYKGLENIEFATPHANGFEHPKMPILCNDVANEPIMSQWGLIPHWVKDVQQAKALQAKTLNARAETIYEKASFKDSVLHNRCLVLAEGYYEYHHYKGKMYPYYIYLKSEQLFTFAGIWSEWQNGATQEKVHTFAIVTTAANDLVAKIHNKPKHSADARMPLILSEEDEQEWLNANTPEIQTKYIKSYPSALMEAVAIGKIGLMNTEPRLF